MARKLLLILFASFTIQSCETLSNLPGTGVTEAEAAGGIREPYLMPGPADIERFTKGLRDLRIREIDELLPPA